MKATSACYACLERLARQAGRLSTSRPGLAEEAAGDALEVLKREFTLQTVTVVVAAGIHRAVRERSGNPDPYRRMKMREMGIASELFPVVSSRNGRSLSDAVKLAALGNTIDFFREPEVIMQDMSRPFRFVADDTVAFAARLKEARRVLYLADNAGEAMFDLPLLRAMREYARVTYVVKPSPVQDDMTPEDIEASGLAGEVGEIMTTGVASPGVDMARASTEFLAAFASADLVFAKGMGYWESLSELPAEGKTMHCLMAKCQPVADSLGVPLGSYVARMR